MGNTRYRADSGALKDEEFFEHYGIPGMKWGRRKNPKLPASTDSTRSNDIKLKAKENKVKALSNAEMKVAIERMNLEQQYKRLAVNDKPVVQRFIASTLMEIGKREVQTGLAKGAAKLIAKSAIGGV